MKTTNRRRVAAVVEGSMEYAAVPVLLRNLGLAPSVPYNLHGQSVDESLDRYVRRAIIPAVDICLQKHPDIVLVLLDREDRDQCPGSLASMIAKIINRQRVAVVIANRRIENWIIADSANVNRSKLVNNPLPRLKPAEADGRNALEMIKRAMSPTGYKKATHGVALLARVNCIDKHVRARSASIDKFVRSVVC